MTIPFDVQDALHKLERLLSARIRAIESDVHNRMRATESRITEYDSHVFELELRVLALEGILNPPPKN